MKRRSSTRSLAAYLGQIMVTPALAVCLLSGATDVHAQSKDQSTSQVDQQSREQAREIVKQAKAALRQGDLTGARTLLEKARAIDAEASGLASLEKDLARALEKAASGGEQAAEANRQAVSALLDEAETQLDAGQFGRARETVSKILQLDAENRRAPRLLEKINKAELSARESEAAGRIQQDVEAAQRLSDAGRLQEAQAAWQAILQQAPDNRAARRGLARAEEALRESADKAQDDVRDAVAQAVPAAQAVAVSETPAPTPTPAIAAVASPSPRPTPMAAVVSRTNTPEEAEAVRRAEEDARRRAEERRLRAAQAVSATPAPTMAVAVEVTPAPTEVPPPTATPVVTPEPVVEVVATATPEPTPEPLPEPVAMEVTATPTVTPAPEMSESPFTEPVNEAPVATIAEPAEMAPEPALDAAAAEEAERARREAEKERLAQARAAQAERELAEKEQATQDTLRRKQAERAYEEGVQLYEKGELARARQRWNDAKEFDPTFLKPDSYLQNTEEEYNAYLANRTARDDFEAREAAALEKMNTLIPFSTQEPLPLAEFLRTLRLLSDIDFVVAGQVDAKVDAAFEDEPLHAVLDSVLHPIGLRWERKPGTDTIVITPDLRTEVFPVVPETLSTVDALIQQGVIARLLYGPQGQPVMQGQEIMTDPRQNVVIVTDSEQNLQKFRGFLDGLKGTTSAQLIFKSFEIDEKKAPQVKALLDAILKVDDKAPYNTERKLILEGSTLIIKDTPENVQKVEQILQDEKFLARFYDNTLSVDTFNLTPVLAFENNPDLSRSFADQVRQVVETLLYAKEGRSRAESEGRRLFYDPATMQMTVVDYPDRLEAVQNYIQSLPQIRSKRRSKIIFLDWATAGELVAQIQSFTGAEGGNQVQATGEEVTKSLRTEDELNFRGAVIRVLRVNENDAADENDDSVELYVRTGTENQETTIEEFRSEFVDDFELVAEDISPSNTPGEGRVRLKVRYVPGGQDGTTGEDGTIGGSAGGDLTEGAEGSETAEGTEDAETPSFTMVEIENLNAIFVEYDNIEDLREVEFWVKTLDIPTLQVSIEIKFVEVVTNKAKQLKSALNFGDLTGDMSLSDSVLRNRFGQDRDEYSSPFESLPENQDSANLLKGTTVFDFIVNNGSSPISVELRMLEAQGLINVVNGPTVTVINNETADFEIERQFGVRQPVAGATGGSSGGNDQLTAVASLRPVEMSVTPVVTRAGNITLNIDVEMQDFDQNLGQLTSLAPTTTGTGTGTTTTGVFPNAFANSNNLFGVLRKQLTTQARIKDGGTVVLGGWRNERTDTQESGVPVLRDIPYIGKLLFSRFAKDEDKITLLIFLTGQVVRD